MTDKAAGAASSTDSLQLIARDAATYAEGAGEPEFSQFLRIEARIHELMRAKATLIPYLEVLSDALEDALELASEGWNYIEERDRFDWDDVERRKEALRIVLREVGRLR